MFIPYSSKAGILGRWTARFAGAPVILHTIHGWGFHERQNPLNGISITDSPVVGMVACFKPQKDPQDFLKVAAIVKRNLPEQGFFWLVMGSCAEN